MHQDTIRIPADYDRFAHSPQVRFRALLPGDTDFFAPWRARSPAHDDMWLETALRLKLNTVEGYSTIEPGYEMSSYARLISRYGLVLASHHTSGLNTSFATWNAYWTKVRKMAAPKLRLADEAAICDFFRYNAETVHRSGIENLWTLAFRGARDEPFWNIFEDAPKDDAAARRSSTTCFDCSSIPFGKSPARSRLKCASPFTTKSPILWPRAYSNRRRLRISFGPLSPPRDPYPYDDLALQPARAGSSLVTT